MSDDEELVRTTVQMPRHLRDAAKAQTDRGELSELVRGVFRRVAFGDEVEEREQLQQELDRVRDEKDDARATIREARAEIESLEKKEDRLEKRLAEKNSRDDKYDGVLQTIEGMVIRGERVFVGHPEVETASSIGGVPQEEVIEDLQSRNPQIPAHAFQDGLSADTEWTGVEHTEDVNDTEENS